VTDWYAIASARACEEMGVNTTGSHGCHIAAPAGFFGLTEALTGCPTDADI